MKKIIFCFFALFSFCGLKAQSDDAKISGWLAGVEFRGSSLAEKRDNKLGSMELDLSFGYGFSRRISLYVPLTETAGLFKNASGKSYEMATQLGLGLGYSPLHTSRYQLEIIAKAGSSLGGTWQFMYYDAGVRFGLSNSIYLGVGIRYYSCYGGGFGNYCNYYGAIGFRINRYKQH